MPDLEPDADSLIHESRAINAQVPHDGCPGGGGGAVASYPCIWLCTGSPLIGNWSSLRLRQIQTPPTR